MESDYVIGFAKCNLILFIWIIYLFELFFLSDLFIWSQMKLRAQWSGSVSANCLYIHYYYDF